MPLPTLQTVLIRTKMLTNNKPQRGGPIFKDSTKAEPSPEMVEATKQLIAVLAANVQALGRFRQGVELQRRTESDTLRFGEQLAQASSDVEIAHIIVEATERIKETSAALGAMQSNALQVKSSDSKANQSHSNEIDGVARILSVIALVGGLISGPLLCRYYLKKGLKKAGLM